MVITDFNDPVINNDNRITGLERCRFSWIYSNTYTKYRRTSLQRCNTKSTLCSTHLYSVKSCSTYRQIPDLLWLVVVPRSLNTKVNYNIYYHIFFFTYNLKSKFKIPNTLILNKIIVLIYVGNYILSRIPL